MVMPPSTGGNTSAGAPTQVPTSTGAGLEEQVNPLPSNGIHPSYAPHIPFSARRAPPLDMKTVERRGHPLAVRESNKRQRPYALQEAPTFRPSEEEFRDPMEYMRKIAPEGRKYGICKIIPPDGWTPEFAVDTERFHFRTRRQELNSVEGGTRTHLNYLDQLGKFHKQHGMNLNRFPSVDKRPLDLYKLKKAVETRGGFEKVCKLKKWAEIGRDLGYSGKIMSSLSTSLKNSYQRWLEPYEQYLRITKPVVQQQLEFEYGGPYTPSPIDSPMKRSNQHTPSNLRDDSPAVRASTALNVSLKDVEEILDQNTPTSEPLHPTPSSGFIPVNAGGFTPVNLTPASFQAVNKPTPSLKVETGNGPLCHTMSENTMNGTREFPDYRPSNLGAVHLTNGQGMNPLKRTISHDSLNGTSATDSGATGDADSQNGRRSKRFKKDMPPTVAGSHMSMLRPTTGKFPKQRSNGKPGEQCEVCGGKGDERQTLLICDGCDNGYHNDCLDTPIKLPRIFDWHCPRCLVGTGDYGFGEGGIYSLRQFQERANNFKESYFEPKMQFDPVLNTKRTVTEDDVEREFWRLVESKTEVIEVEYGADIHSTTHGSGFPTAEKNPLDAYSRDPWNLNVLPLHPESLFQNIKSDISGMISPWLYVGMCFSTFCWHNEDHYCYSANYQHFGATKTWYGIPGADAERFEQAMREAVPELFEMQPDLLFQLVTLLPPDTLKKAGVDVYALDQRAGQFVITFPQAYHAGFNHGFNFNEAVNFAPHDWEIFGEAGVERLQDYRRQPCFSHDELLLTAAGRDTTIKTAKWLGPALDRMRTREMEQRSGFLKRHKSFKEHHCKIDGSGEDTNPHCEHGFQLSEVDVPEEEYQCAYCKAYSFLSRVRCSASSKVMCLLHAGGYECCGESEEQRLTATSHTLIYRLSDNVLHATVQKVIDRARIPEAWQEKLDKILDEEPKPSLKVLRSLVSEGDRIPFELPGLPDLKAFVEKCNEWVEEATNYITRKQQNRRKNERVWRKSNAAKAAETEERERELRKIDNIDKLLAQAEKISFDCPEITTLTEKSEAIAKFRQDAQSALKNTTLHSTHEIEDMSELGKGFNVDIPEVEMLDKVVQQMRWNDQARQGKTQFQTLDDVGVLIQKAIDIGIPENNDHLIYYKQQQAQGEFWETKAKELISVESVHYQQLEALSTQAATLPVSRETLAAVDAILSKQREAHKQILSMYERCKDTDFRKRPKYKEVRDVLDSLAELGSKPGGTIDLEKEIKRHEDWMRKGKKLFGKANAPLHILHAHMNYVASKNSHCFELVDKPRMPVEPASREVSPDNAQDVSEPRDVFCICRQPEGGTMIECELCLEWYHGKCLKIARGKVKEDDKYTCPICDWRVRIPRDAARPKLEDLQDWQAEIPTLPFQPEEEDTLQEVISTASNFRDFMRPYTNPIMATPEDVTTQRFYLRKIEGADILLAHETNFFRQELHKWAPVAPEAPPILAESKSTRKPRPTKQQKAMAQLGIDNPDDLPPQYRTKQHSFAKSRKGSDAPSNKTLQPAPQQRNRSDTPLSTSTGHTIDPHTHSHRLPIAPANTHTDPTYTAFFPSHNNNNNNNNHHHPESSPPFVSGPYFTTRSDHHKSPNLGQSPHFPPQSPIDHHNPALDPSLFNPQHNQFAASMSPSHDHSQHQRQTFSPPQNAYQPTHGNIDHMFADFTTDDVAMGHNELEEALDERERIREVDHMAEFLNDP